MFQSSALILLLGAIAYAVKLIFDYWMTAKAVRDCPGYTLLLSPTSALGYLAITVPPIIRGREYYAKAKHDDFEKFGSDVVRIVSVWPRARVMFDVADASCLKEITNQRLKWPKPVERYGLISNFGKNIVVTEGEEWRKHRKIANPAFSEPNNKLVWKETVRITLDMIDNVWHNKSVTVDHAVDITLTIALLVIGSAGFGQKISFADDLLVPPGHKMSFKEALHIVSRDIKYKAIAPSWALMFSKRLRTIDHASRELQQYMEEMIEERRSAEIKVERHDLFSSLLDANQEEADAATPETMLSDSELTGNIFIFLLAGHETTAHTLAFALGLLAMYPIEQEKLYQHIISVLPNNRQPTYEDMNSFSYALAVIYETLRLFPAVPEIPKRSAEDTTLVTTDATGVQRSIFVPQGADIVMHTPGLHYNPKYWKDPYAFHPQRFMEDWPRDAFLPFSGGARQCLGRRFNETEIVAILAILIPRYKIEVMDEQEFSGETFDERKARIFKSKPGITQTPIRIPLVFNRR